MNSFVKSFQEHPSLTVFVVLICSGVFGYSIHAFAEKSELNSHVKAANENFKAIESRFDKLDFDILSRGLESEIFDLERIIERGEAREIDHIRLKKLKSKLNSAAEERRLKIRSRGST